MNAEITQYMKELENVTKDPSILTADQINSEINVVYKVIGMSSTADTSSMTMAEKKELEEVALKVKDILKILSDAKKAIDLTAREKTSKKKQTPFKTNDVAEAKATNVVDMKEISKEELLNEQKIVTPVHEAEKEIPAPVVEEVKEIPAPVKDEITPEEEKREDANSVDWEDKEYQIPAPAPVEEKIPEPVIEKEIPAPQAQMFPENSKVERPVKPVSPKPVAPASTPVEEKKENISILSDEEEAEVIVVDEEKLKKEREQAQEEYNKASKEYNEIVDELSKPFDGDDDIDIVDYQVKESEDETKEKKESLRIETEEERKAREAEIDETFQNLPEEFHLMNIKKVNRTKISDTLKEISKLNTDSIDIKKTNFVEYDVNDKQMVKEYVRSHNDQVASPKVSRIALLMSGHYEEITAFGNMDMFAIARAVNNSDISFAQRENEILHQIYDHVKYVSYSKTKPDFSTWAKNIMYPDLQSLYYAVYDANSTGQNTYNFRCPYCNEVISVTRKNSELSVAVPKELTETELEGFITTKEVRDVNFTKLSKWAHNVVIKKKLPITNNIINYAIPTVQDYLTTISIAEQINASRDFDTSAISKVDELSNLGTSEEDIILRDNITRMLAYLYVKEMGILTRVEGTKSFRYIGTRSKADIISYINEYSIDDYNSLFEGQDVTDIMSKTAARYYLQNVPCNNEKCGKNIKFVGIDPKDIFFFKIGEARDSMI